VSSRKLDFAPYSLAIEDGYAYLAGDWPDKVVVMDLANPTLPIVGMAQPGQISSPWAKKLTVEGRRAYRSGMLDTELAVIDFTTLNAPTVTAVPLGQTHWGIAVADGIVWHAEYVDSVSNQGCYLKATDVHNPAAPQEIANLRVESPDQCSMTPSPLIAIDNDVLYLYMQHVQTWSMNTYDISDPTHPTLQGMHQTDFAWRWTEGGWAAMECGGLAVHDVAARTLTLGLCQPGAYSLFAPGHQVLMPFVPTSTP
jgi:hypothetical protein